MWCLQPVLRTVQNTHVNISYKWPAGEHQTLPVARKKRWRMKTCSLHCYRIPLKHTTFSQFNLIFQIYRHVFSFKFLNCCFFITTMNWHQVIALIFVANYYYSWSCQFDVTESNTLIGGRTWWLGNRNVIQSEPDFAEHISDYLLKPIAEKTSLLKSSLNWFLNWFVLSCLLGIFVRLAFVWNKFTF